MQVHRQALDKLMDRDYQVYRFDWKHEQKQQLLYEELDILFWVGISKSMDQQYLFVESASDESSEIYYLDLLLLLLGNDTNATMTEANTTTTITEANTTMTTEANSTAGDEELLLTSIAQRRDNVLYDIEHHTGMWWMTSNTLGSDFFQLWTAPIAIDGHHQWTRVMDPITEQPLLDGIAIDTLDVVSGFVIVQGRDGEGIPQLWKLQVDDTNGHVLEWERLEFNNNDNDDPAHSVEYIASGNGAFETSTIIVGYQSLVTPLQHVEMDLSKPEQRTILVRLSTHPSGGSRRRDVHSREFGLSPNDHGTSQRSQDYTDTRTLENWWPCQSNDGRRWTRQAHCP
jgi:protease II